MSKKHNSDWLNPGRLWEWARKHPAALIVGALLPGGLLLGLLLAPHRQAKSQQPADVDADETPLFI